MVSLLELLVYDIVDRHEVADCTTDFIMRIVLAVGLGMNFIKSISIRNDHGLTGYPFDLPIIKQSDSLLFDRGVTLLCGDNGSGKSTLLEALAIKVGFNPEGGGKNFNFATKESHSSLHEQIKVVGLPERAADGFFLRSETMYNLFSEIDELDAVPSSAPKIIETYGGQSLHSVSHGESVTAVIFERLRASGLYILDEPEAALSPMRQFAVVKQIYELAAQGAQFIIATHSPIFMAIPTAKILEINGEELKEVSLRSSEHFQQLASFFHNPERFMDILLHASE